MVELIKQNTRRFAKRQMTWFKKAPVMVWLDVRADEDVDCTAKRVLRALEEEGGSNTT